METNFPKLCALKHEQPGNFTSSEWVGRPTISWLQIVCPDNTHLQNTRDRRHTVPELDSPFRSIVGEGSDLWLLEQPVNPFIQKWALCMLHSHRAHNCLTTSFYILFARTKYSLKYWRLSEYSFTILFLYTIKFFWYCNYTTPFSLPSLQLFPCTPSALTQIHDF